MFPKDHPGHGTGEGDDNNDGHEGDDDQAELIWGAKPLSQTTRGPSCEAPCPLHPSLIEQKEVQQPSGDEHGPRPRLV